MNQQPENQQPETNPWTFWQPTWWPLTLWSIPDLVAIAAFVGLMVWLLWPDSAQFQ